MGRASELGVKAYKLPGVALRQEGAVPTAGAGSCLRTHTSKGLQALGWQVTSFCCLPLTV